MNYMVKGLGSTAHQYDALRESINLLDQSKKLIPDSIVVTEPSHPLYMVYDSYDQLRARLQAAADSLDSLLSEMEQ